MSGKTVLALLIFQILLVSEVQAQTPSRTVLDGVYSDAQAARGRALYTVTCSVCHGVALEGVSAPELTGNRFIGRWREGRLDGIYDFIGENMPRGRAPGTKSLRAGEYLDILAYILNVNGYRAGTGELTPEIVADVMFVGKDGPRPVPDGSLVLTVGCLSQGPDNVWVLTNATEPVRSRNETGSTSAELGASKEKRLGVLVFRLADLEAVPDFTPVAHVGHKMQAKGYLVRQPNAERISLSSMEMLNPACTP